MALSSQSNPYTGKKKKGIECTPENYSAEPESGKQVRKWPRTEKSESQHVVAAAQSVTRVSKMYTGVDTHRNKTPLQQTLQGKPGINMEKNEIRSWSPTLPKN